MDPDLIADILERIRRKEEAQRIAQRILAQPASDAGSELRMGWSQCGSNAGNPNFRDECADGQFSCPTAVGGATFDCRRMFFDCGQFTCGDAGFQCQQHAGTGGRDFVCGGRNDCPADFTCNRDHGYFCLASDLCGQTFSCNNSGGHVKCDGSPLNEYFVGGDKNSGDFYCGISGKDAPGGGGFTCAVKFACTTVDHFTCGETNWEKSAFACMTGDEVGSFSCTSSEVGTPAFECNPGGSASTPKHNYTCSAGLLGGYGPIEH